MESVRGKKLKDFGKNKHIGNKDLEEKKLGYIMIMPALAIIIIISIYPIIKTFWYSLFDMQLQNLDSKQFIGFENYIKITKDPIFWQSFWNTSYFTFFSVIIELVIGFIAAFIMNIEFKGKAIVRVAILIPWAIPGIIVALIWQYMFNDKLGVINQILLNVHLISHPIVWLGTKGYAMWAVIIADVWKQLPFMALLLLAGLQMVSKELYEAADVDGANFIKKFWHITLPSMKSVVLVVLLFRIIGAFRIFDTIYGMTAGGPGNSTSSITMYAYKKLFNELDLGYGSTLAIITFLIIFLLSLLYIKLLSPKTED